ncbi:predicted protein [Plenodomus lingam JN3]|uniref:Predicted protein n=1 Tax=Leptosphaeria maculans (strain JN3 / isolate v23.1.3 / race Av1-4-5-6-7-8) TaxID=985895 RepID=E4ZR27_LEPMJ|nr:predicted protein [Plenodomus lingam JN3]CBX93692.1 predicted protein [Plenodomus lingam JN3]
MKARTAVPLLTWLKQWSLKWMPVEDQYTQDKDSTAPGFLKRYWGRAARIEMSKRLRVEEAAVPWTSECIDRYSRYGPGIGWILPEAAEATDKSPEVRGHIKSYPSTRIPTPSTVVLLLLAAAPSPQWPKPKQPHRPCSRAEEQGRKGNLLANVMLPIQSPSKSNHVCLVCCLLESGQLARRREVAPSSFPCPSFSGLGLGLGLASCYQPWPSPALERCIALFDLGLACSIIVRVHNTGCLSYTEPQRAAAYLRRA